MRLSVMHCWRAAAPRRRPHAYAAAFALAVSTLASTGCNEPTTAPERQRPRTVVVQWDDAALQAVRQTRLGPPMVARALAIVHTTMYDAWSAYDARAVATTTGGALRRPPNERSQTNKERAVSFAAYRALVDLFPTKQALFDSVMQRCALDPNDQSIDVTTAAGIGNTAAAAVLTFRHDDGANQLGDLAPGAYADYTGYQPVNTPYLVVDPNRWQPLVVSNADGSVTTQQFVAPHWGRVAPFALTSGAQFRPTSMPNLYPTAGYSEQAQEVIDFSANLTDEQKTITEYWADGPGTERPTGPWALFAQWVSQRDVHNIDDDTKMFFALTNALLDASIAVWDC